MILVNIQSNHRIQMEMSVFSHLFHSVLINIQIKVKKKRRNPIKTNVYLNVEETNENKSISFLDFSHQPNLSKIFFEKLSFGNEINIKFLLMIVDHEKTLLLEVNVQEFVNEVLDKILLFVQNDLDPILKSNRNQMFSKVLFYCCEFLMKICFNGICLLFNFE